MNAARLSPRPPRVLHVEGALVDLARREFIAPDGSRTRIGRVESVLLGRLARTPSVYVSPDELLGLLWPEDASKTHNSVQSVVARVRRLLRGVPDGDKLVQTGYGRGYRFVPPRRPGKPVATTPWTTETVTALVDALDEERCVGLVARGVIALSELLRRVADHLGHPRLVVVELRGIRTTRRAIESIAEAIGADLRGLSLERTRLKLITQILEREPQTLLALIGVSPALGQVLEPLRDVALARTPLSLLIAGPTEMPSLTPRLVTLGEDPALQATADAPDPDPEKDAARALVRCLRALDDGEFGRALALVTDPEQRCDATGLQVELLMARARAELALGMEGPARRHAEEAVVLSHRCPVEALRRRALSLRGQIGAAEPPRDVEGRERLRIVG